MFKSCVKLMQVGLFQVKNVSAKAKTDNHHKLSKYPTEKNMLHIKCLIKDNKVPDCAGMAGSCTLVAYVMNRSRPGSSSTREVSTTDKSRGLN